MCGIAGFIDASGARTQDFLRGAVDRMTSTLRHRGPDGGGLWTDPSAGVALGHRRLAIIDLSPGAAQPMLSECGRFVVVFNGEIYNFQELRRDLETAGCRFRTSSDTEVLLAAVSHWGVGPSLQRFNGMFAFALWDTRERVLHLARDRAGEKPLYYGSVGSAFAFASELKALRAHPQFNSTLNRDALAAYVNHGYVPSPYSIYNGIWKLPPASHLAVRPGEISAARPAPYWSARTVVETGAAAPFPGDSTEAVLSLDSLLRDAVRLRMISDVPLGAFLSGGIDSSAIVALMQVQASRRVKTFTIGFRETEYNEADKASLVARHLGTEHVELYVGPRQALDLIPRLPSLYDEPFADSSQIPTFLLSELTRRHVTVSISGDAGDELFGGYNLYTAGRLLWRAFGWMPAPMRSLCGAAFRCFPTRTARRQARTGRNRSMGDRLRKLAPVLASREPVPMYHSIVSNWRDRRPLVPGTELLSTAFTDRGQWADLPGVVQHMMYLDLITYLPDDILVKVDRASMGVSLESRAPFLDHRVIEFASRLPLGLKLRGRERKWILRHLLYRYVPRELVDRPKSGFAIPLAAWLRGPLRAFGEDLLAEPRLRRGAWFDAALVRSLWRDHLSGARNWEQPLWSILMFEAWLEQQAAETPGSCRESSIAAAVLG